MAKRLKYLQHFLPIIMILILMITAYFLVYTGYVSWDTLKEADMAMKEIVSSNPIFAPLIFIGAYLLLTAMSVPGLFLLSILGGCLFPQPFSTIYVVIGATIGATILFLSASSALGVYLQSKSRPLLAKMERGFQRNAASYLLFLRFVPLFPFWLVNIAPAFFGVKFWTFVWTTFVGVIPGAFVYTQTGTGLMTILEKNGSLTADVVFNIQMKIALLGLAILALLPIVAKRFWKYDR